MNKIKFENKKQGEMNDSMGQLPKIKNRKHALEEIVKIASDKRGHFAIEDSYDWLNLKMKAINKIAKQGLK